MDPLSIAASIAGLLTAAGEVAKIVGPFVSAASEIPQVAFKVHSEVQSTRTILGAVNNLIININTKPLKHASLIKVDQIVTILTDGVLIFSELESAAGCLLLSVPTSQLQQLRCRLQWARKESTLVALLARLEGFKNSLSLILDILQYDSDLRAEQHHTELSANLNRLVESNAALSERLRTLEDVVDARTFIVRPSTIPNTLPSIHHHNEDALLQGETLSEASEDSLDKQVSDLLQVSSFDFEPDLEASWVYRRAKRDTMDYSFRSSVGRSRAWSALSGLSLSEISIISVIALPICSNDLTNSQHYAFGGNHSLPRPSLTKIILESDRSLYHDCLEVKSQLLRIPGFTTLFNNAKAFAAGKTDPLNELRHVLQQGFPFLLLLDLLNGNIRLVPTQTDPDEKDRLLKVAVHEFLFECARILQVDLRDLFTLADLMGDSYIGFMKVVTILATFLTVLSHQKLIQSHTPECFPLLEHCKKDDAVISCNLWHFQDIYLRVVREERIYILQLEQLLESRIAIEKYNLLSAEILDEIFGPISAIINLQAQILLEMEVDLSKSPEHQHWARPFLSWEKGQLDKAYEELAIGEQQRKSDLVIHISTVLDQKPDIKDEYQEMIWSCYNLLSKPRLRFHQYRKFLKISKTHAEYFRRLYAESLELWQVRMDQAKEALRLIEVTNSRIESIFREQEKVKILQELRSAMESNDNLRSIDLNNLRLFGRFQRTDVQDDHFSGFFVCLFPTALLWYTSPCGPREDQNNSEQRARITLAYKHTRATQHGTVSRRDITRIVVGLEPRGSHKCSIHWFCTSNLANSGHMDLCFDSESQMKLWVKALKRVQSPRYLP